MFILTISEKIKETSSKFSQESVTVLFIEKQEGRFIGALLASLVASLVQPVISSVVKNISGRGVRRAGTE